MALQHLALPRNAKSFTPLLLLFLTTSCVEDLSITRRADGSYKLTCKAPLTRCLEQLERTCSSGYRVLEGVDEWRTYGVPVAGGHTKVQESSALVRCISRAVFGDDDDGRPPEPLRLKRPEPAGTTPSPACVPGSTQACVGVGGCAGGQACLDDGSAFGPCECQSPTPPPPGEPAPTAGASAVAVPNPPAPTATTLAPVAAPPNTTSQPPRTPAP